MVPHPAERNIGRRDAFVVAMQLGAANFLRQGLHQTPRQPGARIIEGNENWVHEIRYPRFFGR
jgi:hypothetical protein